MNKKVYLDYNATTPVDQRVLEAMLPYMKDMYGNPSSVHSFGGDSKSALDDAREKVAELIGARQRDICFTAGGSESNNFAIKGAAYELRDKGRHLITTQVEHASVLGTCKYLEKRGYEVTYLSVDSDGMIDIDELVDSIREDTIIVSVMYANNETGVIFPLDRISEITKKKAALLHTDAVQAVGKIEIDLAKLQVDLLSLSSHKLYGPKGAGALYIRKGVNLYPLIHGGGQERGKRSGTENVPAIAGLGKATELIKDNINSENKRLLSLRDKLHTEIAKKIEGVSLNGHIENRLSNTLNLSFEDAEGESLVMNLDLEGVAVSTGSACSEGNVDPSHVLLAMGLTKEQAVSSLRFSFGRYSEESDIDLVIEKLPAIVKRIRTINEK
ncbi:MAG: cysteine desulfurase NifS [Candidatus Dadabacteria bacterium]|nr:cysteine desulfurase NifS [Candidatus Dadabacteria bacterium]NIS07732.1 cysteine desulfurase NifS [Candidatus Dadabacteria bacterium]NIV42337.1 cysteine desulfurase NifS [Candidatus Dadabacteria bacterium]NIY21373.1 cysteine desulfurase NifS [Candidatus Dadabacteria bacterium]